MDSYNKKDFLNLDLSTAINKIKKSNYRVSNVTKVDIEYSQNTAIKTDH